MCVCRNVQRLAQQNVADIGAALCEKRLGFVSPPPEYLTGETLYSVATDHRGLNAGCATHSHRGAKLANICWELLNFKNIEIGCCT